MRFWLSVFLAVFLPLQLGWAAAGAYCQHETGGRAAHVGHHSHAHHASTAQAQPGDAANTQGAYAPDADCGLCHFSPLGVLLPDWGVNLAPLPKSWPMFVPQPAHSHTPPGPERPNWMA
ncbi:MAG: hypothetical protein LWW92_03555 [Rhodocyclales bacterium]|nr:hypothetical protein [Rhodocyclales bacterium]